MFFLVGAVLPRSAWPSCTGAHLIPSISTLRTKLQALESLGDGKHGDHSRRKMLHSSCLRCTVSRKPSLPPMFNVILECDHGMCAWVSCYIKQPASESMVSEDLGGTESFAYLLWAVSELFVTSSRLSPPFVCSRKATENSWIVNLQRSLWDHVGNCDISKQVH